MTIEELEEFCRVYHHKFIILKYLSAIIQDLMTRAEIHDMSKFDEDEFPSMVKSGAEFKKTQYGTPENDAVRQKYSEDAKVHYKKNRHHPEHHPNGIDDMNLMDLMEMLCDWKAAAMRDGNGNMENSLRVCAERYNLSPQLVKILENTAKTCKM